MKKQIKKIIFILILFSINVSLFAANLITDGYYWNYSYTTTSSYDLQTIVVDNLYSFNNSSTTVGLQSFQGYKMNEFKIDFSKNSSLVDDDYYTVFETSTKQLQLNQDFIMFYNNNNNAYGGRISIYDASGNRSIVSGIVKITKTDKDGNSKEIRWFDITASSNFNLNSDNFFGEITTQIFSFEYYFVIDYIENLTVGGNWTLDFPTVAQIEYTVPTVRIKILDTEVKWGWDGIDWGNTVQATVNTCLNTEFYVFNQVYTNNGDILVGNSQSTSDVYNLKITIEKKFDDSTDNFFDGELHDYYSLDFDSYKYGLLTEEPFSLALQISSAHNWFLYLDNEENPSDTEKVEYELYLKYNPNSSSSNFLIKDNQDKILINNIKSSSSSSTLFLQTKSDSATVSGTTKGEYQDTVYLNFITDGWTDSTENSFAEKVITLY